MVKGGLRKLRGQWLCNELINYVCIYKVKANGNKCLLSGCSVFMNRGFVGGAIDQFDFSCTQRKEHVYNSEEVCVGGLWNL